MTFRNSLEYSCQCYYFTNLPADQYWEAPMQILVDLKDTSVFDCLQHCQVRYMYWLLQLFQIKLLLHYVDSDWANNPDDFILVTGYLHWPKSYFMDCKKTETCYNCQQKPNLVRNVMWPEKVCGYINFLSLKLSKFLIPRKTHWSMKIITGNFLGEQWTN